MNSGVSSSEAEGPFQTQNLDMWALVGLFNYAWMLVGSRSMGFVADFSLGSLLSKT